MKIYELQPEINRVAIERVIKELKNVGIELDINNPADRHKAQCLAINLRIEFNQVGGLA